MSQENPLHPYEINEVDAVSTFLCLGSASHDINSYRQAMKNVVSILKPGGKLLLGGDLDNSQYPVGDVIFKDCSLSKDDILGASKRGRFRYIGVPLHRR